MSELNGTNFNFNPIGKNIQSKMVDNARKNVFLGTAQDGWISKWPGHSTVWQLVRNRRNIIGMRTVL